MSENTSIPAPHSVTVEVGGRPLILDTGKIAKQANGAITARYGDTVVLTTACMAPTANDRDFLPLTVDYRENTYSAGKIPGGFFQARRASFGEGSIDFTADRSSDAAAVSGILAE